MKNILASQVTNEILLHTGTKLNNINKTRLKVESKSLLAKNNENTMFYTNVTEMIYIHGS